MRIYCDFDGVIVQTTKRIVEMYNEDFMYYKNFEKVDAAEVNTWAFSELKLADKKTIDHYFNRFRFFKGLELMPDAKETMQKLTEEGHEIIVVTMGYSPNLKGKKIWLQENLPFVDFLGCNYKQYPDKSHIDMSDGVFIDDSYSNLKTTNSPMPILFGESFEWNYDWKGIQKKNWKEMYEFLQEVGAKFYK